MKALVAAGADLSIISVSAMIILASYPHYSHRFTLAETVRFVTLMKLSVYCLSLLSTILPCCCTTYSSHTPLRNPYYFLSNPFSPCTFLNPLVSGVFCVCYVVSSSQNRGEYVGKKAIDVAFTEVCNHSLALVRLNMSC